MRKPIEFASHPLPYAEAQAKGLQRAYCRHVTDGDTYDLLVDLGFLQYAYLTVRLYGVDTPEIFSPASPAELELGRQAKTFVESAILNKPVSVRSYRDLNTFGRFMAEVSYMDEKGNWASLAGELRRHKLTRGDVQ